MSIIEVFTLKRNLMFIRIEKDSINRTKYNARWEKKKTPEVIEAEARRRELIIQEKETKRLLKLARPPKVTVEKGPANLKTKALGAARLNKLNDDACGICMEVHTLRDSVHTSCGHCFGSVCYGIYLEHTHNHERHLQRYVQEHPNTQHQVAFAHMLQMTRNYACPMCRAKNPSLTSYKERAAPVRKTRPAIPAASPAI